MTAIITKVLEEATPQERLAFAQNFLNLDIPADATDPEITASIKQVQPGIPTIFVLEAAPVEDTFSPFAFSTDPRAPVIDDERGKGTLGRGDPRVTIMIPKTDSADGMGAHDIPVGVNGVVWQLQRGVDLNIPWRVVEALRLTGQDIVRHNEEGTPVVSQADRYPITFPYGQPSAEEIAEWHDKVDGEFCP